MAALASVFVTVEPKTDRFEPDLRKKLRSVDGDKLGNQLGTRIGVGLHGAIGSAVSRSAKLFAVGFAAIQGVKVFSGFIADAQESARISRITANAIRSTGGAAKVTAGQVGDLATAISNKTGADDETIQSGQNMLLTFTNVRNELGKGNDIFNQASQSVIDMAAAMNNGEVTTSGVKTASIQLGKALNDPIKGVTALRKVGVAFTTQQTDQIKKLVESGHTLDAQKIILRELGKEFGGTAAAAADPMTKLRTILANVGEDIGTLLLPMISKFAGFLGNTAVPALYKMGAAFKLVLGDDGAQGFGEVMDNAFGNTGKFVGFFRTVGEGIRQLVFGFRAMIAAFKEGDVTSTGFVGVMEQIGVALRQLGDYVNGTVVPALRDLAATWWPRLLAVLKVTASILFGAVIPALVSLAGFMTRHTGLLKTLAAGILAVVVVMKLHTAAMAAQAAGGTVAFLVQYLAKIKLVQIAVKTWTAFQWLLNLALTANPIGLVVVGIAALIAIIVVVATKTQFFQTVWRVAWGGIKKAFDVVFDWIRSRWPLILGILTGPIGAAVILIVRNWDRIKATAVALWNALKAVWQGGVRFIIDVFFGMVGRVLDGAARAFGWVPKLGDKLKNAAADFRKFRDETNAALAGVKSRKITVSATLTASSGPIRGTGVFARATGGPIFGPGTATSDSIPALLSNGEHVLTAKEVRGFGGHAAVEQMRQAAVRRFATGGMVRAEDGSLVPASFYSSTSRPPAGMVRAEDGSLVPASFYAGRGLNVQPRLAGLDPLKRSLAAFNARVDAAARKMALLSGGPTSPGLNGAVQFARSQAGKPYVWGAAGPGGYDCSGFISALVNVVQGRRPYSRRFSTGTLPAGLFAPGKGAFNIGWFRGNPGHVAATVNGVPMESRGGDGVVVGSRSRGAGYSYFTHHGHLKGFATGGPVLPGDPPFDILDPRGRHFQPGLLELLQQGARKYDSGGYLPPGASLAVNGTGRPERVRTGGQEDALLAELRTTNRLLASLPIATVDDRYVVRTVRNQTVRNSNGW